MAPRAAKRRTDALRHLLSHVSCCIQNVELRVTQRLITFQPHVRHSRGDYGMHCASKHLNFVKASANEKLQCISKAGSPVIFSNKSIEPRPILTIFGTHDCHLIVTYRHLLFCEPANISPGKARKENNATVENGNFQYFRSLYLQNFQR